MRASIWMNETFTNTSPDGVPPSLKSCKDGSVVQHACIHLYCPSVVPADFGFFNKVNFKDYSWTEAWLIRIFYLAWMAPKRSSLLHLTCKLACAGSLLDCCNRCI